MRGGGPLCAGEHGGGGRYLELASQGGLLLGVGELSGIRGVEFRAKGLALRLGHHTYIYLFI